MLEPLIIGHRGASAAAPENTLMAFEQAMSGGADGVEFDVQLARDGVPVVIHDASLKRTALRPGLISDFTSAELEKIDVGTWFNRRYPARANGEFTYATVPTLATVLDYFRSRKAMLYIEMKFTLHHYGALAREVVRLIHEFDLTPHAVVESFALESIREIKRVDPGIRTAALFEPQLSQPIRMKHAMINEALRYQADEIALHRSLVTTRALIESKRQSLPVVVWTVDHPSWIQRGLKDGIHAIITNVPGHMCAERRKLFADQARKSSDAILC